MLEGHEAEVKIGLLVAGIAFALGWLCGGGYYARRERKSRHKLRF
jgi:predicted MFS family arabinose efflux permease